MQLQSAEQGQKLQDALGEYRLEFLLKRLSGVRDIDQLVSGIFGKDMLASLVLLGPKDLMGATLTEYAEGAFRKLSDIRRDFLEEYGALRKKSGMVKSDMRIAAEAFSSVMKDYGMKFGEETLSARGLLNGLIDCDLSAYLFMQLGREVGLDLAGVDVATPGRTDHYVVAHREGRKVCCYVETNWFLERDAVEENRKGAKRQLSEVREIIPKLEKKMLAEPARGEALGRKLEKARALEKKLLMELEKTEPADFALVAPIEWEAGHPAGSYRIDEQDAGASTRLMLLVKKNRHLPLP